MVSPVVHFDAHVPVEVDSVESESSTKLMGPHCNKVKNTCVVR